MSLGKKVKDLMLEIRYRVYEKRHRNMMKYNYDKFEIYEGSDEEFNRVVVPYWEKYGYKPDKKWYQFFGLKEQKFDPHFIPEDYFYTRLYPFLNNMKFDEQISNKIFTDNLFYDINKPVALVKHARHLFIDKDENLITLDEVIDILRKEGKSIIKPSDAMQGEGVEIIDFSKDEKNAINTIKKHVEKGDFIVQRLVKQNEQMNRLNASSVNTMRLTSLLVNDKVEMLSTIVRYGQEGSIVDNMAKGGLSRVILPDGTLSKQVKIDEELVELEDYVPEKVIGFEKAVEIIKKIHPRVAHARFIGWDFAVDENNEPVFIELNTYPVTNQRHFGPVLGEFTDIILDEYYEAKKAGRAR